ncbi:type I-F CRISPR-associated protein Csy3 [Hydrogenimonas sp. SS33]|uniref:type I-F CRISPR-associated protein Csy3 n=1 Tax=Hydrogenimonas leucolamina TaxID=2954236 RepID=UPI00336C2E48
MAKKTVIASVLSFEKKLVPSDGYMYGTVWENRQSASEPLRLVEKSVRGTISNRLKDTVAKDPLKLNAEVEKPNLQTVDSCALAENLDTLKLHFTLKILGGIKHPSACNSPEFLESYQKAVDNYIKNTGFEELGRRYALNLANARFLWRNRVGAEKIEVHIKDLLSEDEWSFDAKKYPLRDFGFEDEEVTKLGRRIAETLADEERFMMLDIVCYAKAGKAQEIYPSEELVMDKGQGNKSKVLYSVDDIAAMHSQKIGNALRTIDTWYPDFAEEQQPIAIEPYGAVTNLGRAFRTPVDKEDFYTLFDRFVAGENLTKSQEHYVMAVLIRGGVFGESEK